MLRDAAVARVKVGLGFRTDLDSEIVEELQAAQRLLEQGQTLPWFLVEEDDPLTVGTTGIVNLPDSFIREVEHGLGMRYRKDSSSAWNFLRVMGWNEATAAYGIGSTADFPVAYTIRENTIQFFPAPTSNKTVYWDWYEKDEVLTANNENRWLKYAPDLLIGRAGMSVAETIGKQRAFEKFNRMASQAWMNLLKENAARGIANRSFILGRNS